MCEARNGEGEGSGFKTFSEEFAEVVDIGFETSKQ